MNERLLPSWNALCLALLCLLAGSQLVFATDSSKGWPFLLGWIAALIGGVQFFHAAVTCWTANLARPGR